MTQALGLRGHETVLEVGTGSGYGAAVLAACAAEVISVEYDEDLVVSARRSLAVAGAEGVEVRHGDGALGAPDRAPFDAISVTAMVPEPPQALLGQLAAGGTLLAPLGTGTERHPGPVARRTAGGPGPRAVRRDARPPGLTPPPDRGQGRAGT